MRNPKKVIPEMQDVPSETQKQDFSNILGHFCEKRPFNICSQRRLTSLKTVAGKSVSSKRF